MAHRALLGTLMIILGLLWALPVWGQDEEKTLRNDSDLAYQEALRVITLMSGREIGLDDGNPCEQPMGAEPLIFWYGGLKALPPEIGQVRGIYDIYVDNNQLTTLPPEIAHIRTLGSILASSNELTNLPPEIGQLNCLHSLILFQNQLMTLPPEIGQLKNLYNLDLAENQLTSLPPEIGQLESLEYLNLSFNRLTALPVELGQLTRLRNLTLLDNPLTFPPPDIVAQGTPAILAYLRDYEAMLMRQTIAGIAGGVGAIAGVLLLFRWRQRRGLTEKKKRA